MADVMQGFFKEVGKNKLLSRDEEVQLSQMMESDDKDLAYRARERMIQSNIRLAISIAKHYQNRGCDFEDLVQESTVGLMKAVDRFDWRRGFKFSTYATWWIRQAVMRHITLQSSTIHLPSGANSIVWRAKKVMAEYEREFGVQPSIEEIADLLGVGKNMLGVIMQTSKYTLSLDAPTSPDGDSDSPRLCDVIEGENGNDIDLIIDREKISAAIRKGFASLTSREEKILRLRFGITEDPTDHTKYPITREEIQALQSKKETV
jgi:RNA polymerase primary sigma factor